MRSLGKNGANATVENVYTFFFIFCKEDDNLLNKINAVQRKAIRSVYKSITKKENHQAKYLSCVV